MTRPGEVMLNPGDFCFAGDGRLLRTLLGSCVSVTMWHPRLRIGGMCHYMNPSRTGHLTSRPRGGAQAGRPRCVGDPDLDGRYADEAMTMFLRALERTGTSPREYEVQMFGGGNQFPGTTGAVLDVSRDNVAAGLRLLDEHGFVLTARHLGGTGFRRVDLDLATGRVAYTHVGSCGREVTT